jgi:hypothetical protein
LNGVGDGPGEESRTDLDSYANVPVVGSGAHVLVDRNRTCEASPYSPDIEPVEVPLVDAAVRYDRDGRVYILLIPSLDYILLSPFMMREAGVIVKTLQRYSWMTHRRRTFPFPRWLYITLIVHHSLVILGIGVCVRVPPSGSRQVDFVRFNRIILGWLGCSKV